MHSTFILYVFFVSHGLLMLSTLLFTALSDRRLRPSYYLWMLMLPVFGPLTGWIFMRALMKPSRPMEMRQQSAREAEAPLHQVPVNEVVPLEEALLIDDPVRRRALMMHVLRSDPMQYLDLLLVARFNDDTETAHYATATIMEVQRRFQTEIHQMQADLARNEDNFDKRRAYSAYLFNYCQSGLLQGQLLRRQRMMLKKALEHTPRLEEDPLLIHITVQNSLSLGDAQEARTAAQTLMTKWPLDEASWLEGMRVYAQTRDQAGMQNLFEEMQDIQVDFTAKGREQMLFWKERIL